MGCSCLNGSDFYAVVLGDAVELGAAKGSLALIESIEQVEGDRFGIEWTIVIHSQRLQQIPSVVMTVASAISTNGTRPASKFRSGSFELLFSFLESVTGMSHVRGLGPTTGES